MTKRWSLQPSWGHDKNTELAQRLERESHNRDIARLWEDVRRPTYEASGAEDG